MTAATLARALGPGPELVIDSSVTLSYLNGTDVFSSAAAELFDTHVAAGRFTGVLSAVTVTECLVRPFQVGPAAVLTAETFLAHFAGLRIRVIDMGVAREAARIRALTNPQTHDALVLATAIVEGIHTVVSTDDRWQKVVGPLGLAVVHLGAHLPL